MKLEISVKIQAERKFQMKKSLFGEDPIVRLLKHHDNCQETGISQATFYAWKKRFGGMSVSEAKRLRELENENARLKKLV